MNEPTHLPEPSAQAAPAAFGYREFKLLLRADHFVKPEQFRKFWKVTRRTAKAVGVDMAKHPKPSEPHLREVLFFDTPRFRLYNHGFIVRQRTFYQDGLPEIDHEVTVKYRNPDLAATAAIQMHPNIPGLWIMKFKEELLMDHGKVGSLRAIYARSAKLKAPGAALIRTFGSIAEVFPVLLQTGAKESTALSVVNDVALEEVLVNMGEIDFGGRVIAKATLAIWRNRRTQEHLLGEYGYQIRVVGGSGLHGKPKDLSEAFFVRLQIDAAEWLHIGTTKTAMVYSLGRATINHHE
jgi:hypothetical protein